MKTQINLPHVMTDNESRYINLVVAAINYTSPESNVTVHYHDNSYNISVELGNIEFRQELIDNLLGLHRALKLKITFSSSLAISKLVSYKINFADKK